RNTLHCKSNHRKSTPMGVLFLLPPTQPLSQATLGPNRTWARCCTAQSCAWDKAQSCAWDKALSRGGGAYHFNPKSSPPVRRLVPPLSGFPDLGTIGSRGGSAVSSSAEDSFA